MVDRKVVSFDEFYYQLKLMHLFLLHPVYVHTNRRERDVTNDDVFRAVCSVYLRPSFAQI
jgi:hypothetical protein